MITVKYKKDEIPSGLEKYVKPVEGSEDEVSVTLLPKEINEQMKQNVHKLTEENEDLKGKAALLETLIGDDKTVDEFQEELNELRAIKQKVDDGKLEGSDKIQEEVNRRVEAFKENYEAAQAKLKESYAEAQAKVEALTASLHEEQVKHQFHQSLSQLPEELQIRQGAVSMVMEDVLKKFKIDDEGNLVGKGPDGKVLLNESGEPMSITNYISDTVASQHPFLFENFKGADTKDSFVDSFSGEAVDLESASGADILRSVYGA